MSRAPPLTQRKRRRCQLANAPRRSTSHTGTGPGRPASVLIVNRIGVAVMPARLALRHIALAALALACVGLGALPAPAGAAKETGVLTVTFQGLKTRTGSVMLSLACSEAAYGDKAPATGQAMIPVSGDAAVVTTFKGLAPGRCAIKAFHDVNGDGKMGANPFGIPTEPFAFSNNAHGAMGPATWADASFEVKAGDNAQTLDID